MSTAFKLGIRWVKLILKTLTEIIERRGVSMYSAGLSKSYKNFKNVSAIKLANKVGGNHEDTHIND